MEALRLVEGARQEEDCSYGQMCRGPYYLASSTVRKHNRLFPALPFKTMTKEKSLL